MTTSPVSYTLPAGGVCMKGSVQKRAGADWWYVRLYWQKKYRNFTWYGGNRMYSDKIAYKLLSQIQGDIERGVFNPLKYTKGQSPIAAYLWEWYEINESTWAPATAKAYHSYIKIHLEPYFLHSRIVVQDCPLKEKEKTDMNHVHRTYRTLVRVHEVHDDFVLLIIPGWNAKLAIRIDKVDLPSEILSYMIAGNRLHAQVNIGSEKAEDLRFSDWESC